jgi:hypothetical protein
MSTKGRGVFEGGSAPRVAAAAGDNGGGFGVRAQGNHGGQGAGGGGQRKRRRRQRGQRNNIRRNGPSTSAHSDGANRERVFQDIEGLLRQIRELAEDSAAYTQEQLADFTQMVVGLFKQLEGEAKMVSERVLGEYQRVRDRLNQALQDRTPPRDESTPPQDLRR